MYGVNFWLRAFMLSKVPVIIRAATAARAAAARTT